MRGAMSSLLLLASVSDGARLDHAGLMASMSDGARVDQLPSWGHSASFNNFINRANQARALAQRATDTHARWVAVRDLMGETSVAAAEGQVAMQELGVTFNYIDQEIVDNELQPLLDTELTVADLRALRNGDALVRISQEFIATSEQLVTVSNLLEVIVETMVAVLDLTESVPELSGAWRGFDTQHLRALTAGVSVVSERFADEAHNLREVNEQLQPLQGWDEMGRWGRARVVALNFNQLRSGMRGLRQSKQSIEEFYNGEAMATMTDVVSTVQSMTSTVNSFSAPPAGAASAPAPPANTMTEWAQGSGWGPWGGR